MHLCLVEWMDAESSCTAWVDRENTEELKTVRAIAVGLLYHEDSKSVSIVLARTPMSYSQAITIPKGSIVRTRRLKIK